MINWSAWFGRKRSAQPPAQRNGACELWRMGLDCAELLQRSPPTQRCRGQAGDVVDRQVPASLAALAPQGPHTPAAARPTGLSSATRAALVQVHVLKEPVNA